MAIHKRLILATAAAWLLPATLQAGPSPEIVRARGKPQPTGVLHTVRAIPEACMRLEGAFTGEATAPYRLAAVRTSPACQARARFVEAATAKPSAQGGWRLNDVVRVPSAECPSREAVVRVWRKPGEAAAPALDAQGRARIYLQDAGKPGGRAMVTLFAATLAVEGATCR